MRPVVQQDDCECIHQENTKGGDSIGQGKTQKMKILAKHAGERHSIKAVVFHKDQRKYNIFSKKNLAE